MHGQVPPDPVQAPLLGAARLARMLRILLYANAKVGYKFKALKCIHYSRETVKCMETEAALNAVLLHPAVQSCLPIAKKALLQFEYWTLFLIYL